MIVCTDNDANEEKILRDCLNDFPPTNSSIRHLSQLEPLIELGGITSTESRIYRTSQLGGDSIIKIPIDRAHRIDLLRSYLIGLELNKLSGCIPTFIQTRGLFEFPDQIVVAYEYIAGRTLAQLIQQKLLAREDIVNITAQILLALELSQRICSFTHFDLHLHNIMVVPVKSPVKYTVALDNHRYDIVAERWLAKIIDYGQATIRYKQYIIGSGRFKQYGLLPYMIPGADMYKYLFHCYAQAVNSKYTGLIERIATMFLFYGNEDPYQILLTSPKDVSKISVDYLQNVVKSVAATFLPIELLDWILAEKNLACSTVRRGRRNIYQPITVKPTEMIYDQSKIVRTNSYILNKYWQRIVGRRIRLPNKVAMINTDKTALKEFSQISLPDENDIIVLSDYLLSIRLGSNYDRNRMIQFLARSDFIRQLGPFFQYFYTIKELRLKNIYEQFMTSFENSPHYLLYNRLSRRIERTRRWCQVLQSVDGCAGK